MDIDWDKTTKLCEQIAKEVRNAPLQELPGWSAIIDYYQARGMTGTLFAIDSIPGLVQVYTDRRFDTRANVLMEYPFELSSGRVSFGSQRFSAMVYGRIAPRGEIHIERFRFNIDDI